MNHVCIKSRLKESRQRQLKSRSSFLRATRLPRATRGHSKETYLNWHVKAKLTCSWYYGGVHQIDTPQFQLAMRKSVINVTFACVIYEASDAKNSQ